MTVFSLTVGRNEEHRYLEAMLKNSREAFDKMFFFDDRSTDATRDIASMFCDHVSTRPSSLPSFICDEGSFRGAAWEAFERWMQPKEADWVVVIDCDEQLIGSGKRTPREALVDVVCGAEPGAVDINIPEVFGIDFDGCPLVRTDRLWGTIHAPRLFTYRRNGVYYPGHLGVPAVPSYVMSAHWQNTELISIMHFGYADATDAQEKYARYVGEGGHSHAHVESITALDKQLVRWEYPHVKEMYRGRL